jgi:hypothetical protein
VNPQLEALVNSLLYEGYALYPYTPGATKNATPTPFGIVYPPAYARDNPATFDHLRAEGIIEAPPGAELTAQARFMQAAGERHQGTVRRIEVPATPLRDLVDGGVGREFELEGDNPLSGRVRLRAWDLGAGLHRVAMCVHNTTALLGAPEETGRGEALQQSLLSTHVVLETSAGRFISPLEREGEAGAAVAECRNVNTFPVLAADGDDALLGAAIVLPDHPRMAPESLGNLFDNTEIEEALLLHVQALSDGEREEIERQDPAVREMIARASAATPDEMLALHGRMTLSEPGGGHPVPGERELTVAGATLRRGGKVVLKPGTDRDVYDRMLDGRTATIERIFVDVDGTPHVGVTVDDDPAAELFRETGRYLFFKASELEPEAE